MVVDDEPLARKVVCAHIKKIPSLEIVKECCNAMEAAAFLHTNGVDLIFLDIKMPEMTGLEFLKTLDDPPQVIVTTAFSEYALEGYEYAVTDYLLKPIAFERFLKAVNKAMKKSEMRSEDAPRDQKDATQDRDDRIIFLKAQKAEHKLKLSEIRCVEGWRNSVKVHVGDRVILVPQTMASLEEILPVERFVRVHKSFIVAIDEIERIQGGKVYLHTMSVPIGKYYKKDLEKLVASHRLRRDR